MRLQDEMGGMMDRTGGGGAAPTERLDPPEGGQRRRRNSASGPIFTRYIKTAISFGLQEQIFDKWRPILSSSKRGVNHLRKYLIFTQMPHSQQNAGSVRQRATFCRLILQRVMVAKSEEPGKSFVSKLIRVCGT